MPAAPENGRPGPARFVPGACPATSPSVSNATNKTRCGFLVVPENWANPRGRKIRLAVTIVPSVSARPAPDPIVFFYGGPGGDATVQAQDLVKAGLNNDHDIILMSQRGTFSSRPSLYCPEIYQFNNETVGRVLYSPSTGRLYVKAVTQCRRRLVASGINLADYTTAQSADDYAALRVALRIRQWDVLAHSYGTDLALTYMREHPQGIRSVALDGVTPPPVASPGWTWSSLKEGFDSIIRACKAQPRCRARYPHIAATFTRLVIRLQAHPVTTTVRLPGIARPVKVVLDGGTLVNWLIPASHDAKNLPLSIYELAHGHPRMVAEAWAATRVTPPSQPPPFSWGLSFSVWCSEWVPYETPAAQFAAGKRAFPAFPASVLAQAPQLTFLRAACQAWNVPTAPPSVRAVTRSTIPTLAITGSFDTQTGAQWGYYAARTLSRSTVVTLPGVAHGAYYNSCGASVITSFFDHPRAPDTRCVASLRPPPFTIAPSAGTVH
jgi:pimeloyl-ACP methyl ester carboxylesterase